MKKKQSVRGRKRDELYEHYSVVDENAKHKRVQCGYCQLEMNQNRQRMLRHLIECDGASKAVKDFADRVIQAKANKDSDVSETLFNLKNQKVRKSSKSSGNYSGNYQNNKSAKRARMSHATGVKKAALNDLSTRTLDGTGLRVAICYTRWNKEIMDALLTGAVSELKKQGVAEDDIIQVLVPGAYELPYAASRIIKKENVDAVICLGCLIKGETMHFEYICEAVTQGIMKINLELEVPTLFGVLACLDEKQARARAGLEEGGHNHGVEWAQSAVEMANLKKRTEL